MIFAESASANLQMKAKFRGSENHPGNMTDSIADMIIRFKNAGASGKESLSVPYSKFKHEICNFLEKEGYIKSVSRRGKKIAKSLEVELLYENDKPKIREVKRVSKLSRRVYKKAKDIRPVKNGYGILVMSTARGLLSGKDARRASLGGEALFEIW